MRLREAGHDDLDAWAGLRHALWPACDVETARREAEEVLASEDQVCYLLLEPQGAAIGFVEGAVHTGPDGPYAHVEGWYVVPDRRGHGYGRDLIGALEPWCLHRAIYRLTSDTTKDYPLSPRAHQRAGFTPIHQLTIFLKELDSGHVRPASRTESGRVEQGGADAP